MWPESMRSDWKDCIAEELEIPFAYCIHDKDVDKVGAIRKEHVHILVAFNNTTTYNHALRLFQRLGVCDTVKNVISVRNMYDYLIHDTDDARKKGKFQYLVEERILGNHFDIGSYEQLSLERKKEIKKEIINLIDGMNFQDFWELTQYIYNCEDDDLIDTFESNQGFFNNVVKGRFNNLERKRKFESI